MTRRSDGERLILAEIERDARAAMEGWRGCTGCGADLPEAAEADAFWVPEDDEYHRVCGACAVAMATADVNRLDVPEVRRYFRRVIDGGTVVTYEQRQPGEAAWSPVPAGWGPCPTCGALVPPGSVREGACQPCRLAALARSV